MTDLCLRTSKPGKKVDRTTIFMMSNGKILLERLIASCNGKCNPIRSFSSHELTIATNNYDTQKVITDEIVYQLYKGSLQDRPISVMKFKEKMDPVEHCFNSIVFASQMSHKNILKLIGCCLETHIPILVFESVEYGTLADRIYNPRQLCFQLFSLKQRLKIAMEIANAVAYLHVGFPRPVIFRDIKASSVLFDEHHVAKLFDFSLSVAIPEGETHVKDAGPLGILAPEYMTTGDCNEKCDLFCFGALLLELLTGQKLADPRRRETGGAYFLRDHVKKYIELNRFNEIIDPMIINGDGTRPRNDEQQLLTLIELAFKCLSKPFEDRPTIVDVAKQLRKMYLSR